MLATDQPHSYEEALTMWWCILCATGGLFLLVLGARAVGLALLGAVGGAFIGATMGVTGGPEELATALPLGASVGLVVGGLIGLILPESLAPSVLRRMGIGISVLGSVAVLVIHIGASTTCLPRFSRNPLGTCLPSWGPLAQALFVVDALFVAALCFVTAAREDRTRLHRGPRSRLDPARRKVHPAAGRVVGDPAVVGPGGPRTQKVATT